MNDQWLLAAFTALFSALFFCGLGLIQRIVAADLYQAVPWLSQRIVKMWVRCLPSNHRDRYQEDWSTMVSDSPTNLIGLCRSIWLGFGIRQLRVELAKPAKITSGEENSE